MVHSGYGVSSLNFKIVGDEDRIVTMFALKSQCNINAYFSKVVKGIFRIRCAAGGVRGVGCERVIFIRVKQCFA